MEPAYTTADGAVYWNKRYETGKTRWHREEVHRLLKRHYNKLNPDGKAKNVLVTMCGMTVDMNWLADKGLKVVGVDIALQALTRFMANSGQNWTEQPAPNLGIDAKVFTRDDGKIKLYCGDVLNFSSEFEGKFSAIYDCDGIHTFPDSKAEQMAEMMKEVLAPGGKIFLDAVEYDPKILELEDLNIEASVPPPYPVTLAQIKSFFEPECTVDLVETHKELVFCMRKTDFNAFIISKK